MESKREGEPKRVATRRLLQHEPLHQVSTPALPEAFGQLNEMQHTARFRDTTKPRCASEER